MSDNLPHALAGADEAEEIIREMATLIVADTGNFNTTWECANRVCDRYQLPSAA